MLSAALLSLSVHEIGQGQPGNAALVAALTATFQTQFQTMQTTLTQQFQTLQTTLTQQQQQFQTLQTTLTQQQQLLVQSINNS